MCRKTPLRSASDQWDGYPVSDTNSIGALFRAHGERYIQAYKPHQRAIAFIRSVRLCRTPGLGRIVYTCKGCGEQVTIYKSCGNSQCPVCQSIKREQWADALQENSCASRMSTWCLRCLINSMAWHEAINQQSIVS